MSFGKIMLPALTAALLCGVASTATAQTVLRYADYGPNRGARAEALQWFADELEQRSDGALSIEFFWGGSLLSGGDTLNGVANGVADLGTVVGFFTPRELQAYNIADLPVDNSDMWIGMRAVYELAQTHEAMKSEFDNAGVRYLTNFTTGPIQLICNTPIEDLSGIAGKTVRASGPYGDTLAQLGAEVSQMSQADVYQALDSGLMNCNQNYYYAIEAYRQHEVAQNVLEMDWGQNMSFGIVMNAAAYERLSDEETAVLDKVSSDFIDHLAQVMMESDEKAKAAMVEGIDGNPVTVTELSDADRETLNEASEASIDAWVSAAGSSGIDGEQLLADYQTLIEKYRERQESGGYPWTD